MNYKLGSEWHKWDLHIHTPNTKLSNNFNSNGEDVWETYCNKLENSDVQVFGITDYFCSDNYFTFIEKNNLYNPNSKKVFFPNIEFRLEVSVNKNAEEVNIHVLFSNEVSKQKLDSFLSKLNTNLTRNGAIVTCKELKGDQFESAAINHIHLKEILKEVFGSHKCYLIIAASNNAGLRGDTFSPRKLNITDEIDKICDGFFGGLQNVEYFLRTNRYETDEPSKPKPVLAGSDCHSFNEIENFLGKRFKVNGQQDGQLIIEKDITWIKGEKTFEGLRQVFHEPQYRKEICEIKPREPLRKIEKIKFNFPKNIQIKNKNSNEFQDLCIKNLNEEIYISPHFTCFIGGRGTGKSTIINTIAESLGIKTDFFDLNNNSLYLDNNIKCDLKNSHSHFVEIVGTNDIEFVSQGKVEKLTEGHTLTKLIFEERILQLNNNLQELKLAVDAHIDSVKNQINSIFYLKEIETELSERRKEKLTHESIVQSVEDPVYIEITTRIKNFSEGITQLESNEIKYRAIIEKLKFLVDEIQPEEIPILKMPMKAFQELLAQLNL